MLQTLAVIGREFPLELARQVISEPDDELNRLLSDLQLSEFIYERPAAGEIEYTFKHALTQEVAYNSLLQEHRKMLHERIGGSIEAQFPNQLNDWVTTLAHHYRQSDNVGKAVEYLGRAGQQALLRSSYSDALGKLNAAIDLLQKLPSNTDGLYRELALQSQLVQALIGVKGWAASDTELAYDRVCHLAELASDPYQLVSGLWGLSVVKLVRAELRGARESAEKLVELVAAVAGVEGKRDPALFVQAYLALGPILTWLGDVIEARRYLEQVNAVYESRRHGSIASLFGGVDPRVFCLGYLLWTLWHLGYPDQAQELSNEALALAQELSHPHSQAFALTFAAYLHQCRGDVEKTRKDVATLISISAEQGLPNYLAWGTILRGWTLAESGYRQEGITQMRQGLVALRATGERVSSAYHLTLIAEQYSKAHKFEQTSQSLEESSALVELKGIRLYEVEVHRLRGELLLFSDTQEANRCFGKAIEVSRRQGTRSLELRATASLARLLAAEGRRDEARTKLAEIYNWFTEGFDTADLKDAKALLDELSA